LSFGFAICDFTFEMLIGIGSIGSIYYSCLVDIQFTMYNWHNNIDNICSRGNADVRSMVINLGTKLDYVKAVWRKSDAFSYMKRSNNNNNCTIIVRQV
jgi:hypothetical protein